MYRAPSCSSHNIDWPGPHRPAPALTPYDFVFTQQRISTTTVKAKKAPARRKSPSVQPGPCYRRLPSPSPRPKPKAPPKKKAPTAKQVLGTAKKELKEKINDAKKELKIVEKYEQKLKKAAGAPKKAPVKKKQVKVERSVHINERFY